MYHVSLPSNFRVCVPGTQDRAVRFLVDGIDLQWHGCALHDHLQQLTTTISYFSSISL
jgi:hypothetical protein